jgi:hypothetical protein
MSEIKRENEWSDLKTKLQNSIGVGAFFDDNEVLLIMTAFAHSAGIENAFRHLFTEHLTEKNVQIDSLQCSGNPKTRM